jgi:hypothetical protein
MEDVDNSTFLSSRNLHILALSANPDLFMKDSLNSTGAYLSKPIGFIPMDSAKSVTIGPLTLYTQLITCSLTTSASTTLMDGHSRLVEPADTLLAGDNHAWAQRPPLPSRGIPYEDSFSALFSSAGAVPGNPLRSSATTQQTLLEECLIEWSNASFGLGWFESNLMWVTGVSIVGITQNLPYAVIDPYVKSSCFPLRDDVLNNSAEIYKAVDGIHVRP